MDKPIYTEFGEICDEMGIQLNCRARILAALNGAEPDQDTWEEMCEINERMATLEKMLSESASSEKFAVEHPSHYTSGGIECIDAMKAMLAGYEQAKMVTKFYWHFLSGQVFKYLWRWPLKERPLQDLKKARWYLDRLIEDVENQDHAVTELHSDIGKGISE